MRRGRLLAELDHASRLSVVLVAAPAGYGKTTLVAQWLTASRSPAGTAAWLTLDAVDNDPGLLWGHVARALERAGCPLGDDAAGLVAGHRGDLINGVIPRLLTAMGAMPDEFFLVLDDFHVLQDRTCLEQMDFLVEHLPPQAHLFITTRAAPGLRLGRLRVGGQLAEIRAADLTFTADEMSSLLAIQRVELSGEAVEQLLDSLEGWPAGLCLAILSLVGRDDPDAFVRQLSGSERFIGDYLTEEVLSRQLPSTRELIITMSIVDRFSPGSQHFLLESKGSGAHPARARAGQHVPPGSHDDVDGSASTTCSQPSPAPSWRPDSRPHPAVARRAAKWFLDHGHVEQAARSTDVSRHGWGSCGGAGELDGGISMPGERLLCSRVDAVGTPSIDHRSLGWPRPGWPECPATRRPSPRTWIR